MMVATAQDLKTAGIDCPLLVGGAALSNRFTRLKIAPEYDGLVAYANDAMNGLDLANQIMDYERRDSLQRMLGEQSKKLLENAPKVVDVALDAPVRISSVRRDVEIPRPPDLKSHVIRGYDLGEIFSYINPKTLYSKHLGFQNFVEAFEAGEPKARELHDRVEEVIEQMLGRAIFPRMRFTSFPGRVGRRSHCRDFVARRQECARVFHLRPAKRSAASVSCRLCRRTCSGRTDYLCMFVTTIGTGIRALAEEWKNQGDYLRSHILQVLALEGAEAFAELLHLKIRQMWGIGDEPGLTLRTSCRRITMASASRSDIRRARGSKIRSNFFEHLKLTKMRSACSSPRIHDGSESTVSAVVFHHPEAKYFSLSPADIERLEREFETSTRAAS